jgi:hypothetical protein
VLVVIAHAPCPLTWLQNELRRHGGQPRLRVSFLDSNNLKLLSQADDVPLRIGDQCKRQPPIWWRS